MGSWREVQHRVVGRVYRRSRGNTALSWVGDERLAIGGIPTAAALLRLRDEGLTHVVNCRSTAQTWVSQDLAVERALFGPARVAHAPMWDSGLPQPAVLWSAAARFAADALDGDPAARVLVHCQQGRCRSVMVAYAVLRLRGHEPDAATRLILGYRREARIVPAYKASVEGWLGCR